MSRREDAGRIVLVTAAALLTACERSASTTIPATPPGQRDGQPPMQIVVDPSPPWFIEEATQRGVVFMHDSGHREQFYFPECVSGGAALFDMDGDGDLDAYLVQGGDLFDERMRPPNRLFENRGDGTFLDVTEGSGADDRGYGLGVTCGDYDNDGDVDLYVTNLGPNALLRNDGERHFSNVGGAAGVDDPRFGISAAFLDYDADGDLDLFVTNYIRWNSTAERDCFSFGRPDYCEPTGYAAPARDSLYRNEGDGTFRDVSVAAGLDRAFGNGMGVVTGDFDGDGRIDVFVANDQMPNQLWRNRGDGTFEEVAHRYGIAVDSGGIPKAGMGVAAVDHDLDGDLDLFVVNIYGQSDSLFDNEGLYFNDRTEVAGLGVASRQFTRFGLGWHDLDLDGRLDLYEVNGRVRRLAETWSDDPYAEPNVLFAGGPAGRFKEIQPRGGTATPVIATSRAAAFGDIDGDGRLDVLIANRDGPAHLLMNVTESGHWIIVHAIDEHARHSLGATVTVVAGGRRHTRVVRSDSSYAAANDPRVHVGLGDVDRVDAIEVVWPDGVRERFGGESADRVVSVVRGTSRAEG